MNGKKKKDLKKELNDSNIENVGLQTESNQFRTSFYELRDANITTRKISLYKSAENRE